MKILELTNYSAGGCGVFERAKQESLLLSEKGYEVQIFSSNFTKGSKEIAPEFDKIGGVIIRRFSGKKLGGESYLKWNFEEAALEYKPDIIIAHGYRHLHTFKAIKVAKRLNARIYLVTHAPFARSETRKSYENIIVWTYDKFFAPSYLKKFDKIIAISKWELPFLKDLKIPEEKIEYIPNGIPDEFFSIKPNKSKTRMSKLLYFGRVSKIKRIETIIKALALIKNKNFTLEIAGPGEEEYVNELKKIIMDLHLEEKIKFTPAIYDIKNKIDKIDSADICILASKTEGMSQSLVEYLSRGKIVIASNNLGNADLIENNKNGFLFEVDNEEELAELINGLSDKDEKELNEIRKQARVSVEGFAWSKIIKKIENLVKL
jgi:glycosyltransferase involved in cell wall biosynthesis